MTVLWDKGLSIDKSVHRFTVGDDYKLDENLIKADVLGSIAHAKMLNKIGILSNMELKKLKETLIEIYNNGLKIAKDDEDVHTAIENYLVLRLGDTGKKIHTARSRNDQIIVDTRLYTKEYLLRIFNSLIELSFIVYEFCKKYEFVPIPGYTHTRKAMPSSIGLWAGAFLESIIDDIILLKSAYDFNNQCPLGSVAGYGVNLDIDRKLTSDLLGFERLQNNTLYVQNSRGKIEAIVVFSLLQIVNDIARISNEIILFSSESFQFFDLPVDICTGSSVMPQKNNPDILELIRGYASVLEANLLGILGITKNLLSGYNRDLQLTKEPLIKSLKLCDDTINVSRIVFKKLKVNKEKCLSAITKEIYALDSALELVRKGMAFRDAYKEIAKNLDGINVANPIENIKSKRHLGATGNLGLERRKKELSRQKEWLSAELKIYNQIINQLFN